MSAALSGDAPLTSHITNAEVRRFVKESTLAIGPGLYANVAAALQDFLRERVALAPQESLTVERLAELLAEYEGRDGPGLPTGKARWILERLGARPAPPSEPLKCPNGCAMEWVRCGRCDDLIELGASPRLASKPQPSPAGPWCIDGAMGDWWLTCRAPDDYDDYIRRDGSRKFTWDEAVAVRDALNRVAVPRG